jgi:hypothetical protein
MRIGVLASGERVESCAETGGRFVVCCYEAEDVGEGESEGHVFGGRLRDDGIVDVSRGTSFKIFVGNECRETRSFFKVARIGMDTVAINTWSGEKIGG